mgnify:CR=1 FL=1
MPPETSDSCRRRSASLRESSGLCLSFRKYSDPQCKQTNMAMMPIIISNTPSVSVMDPITLHIITLHIIILS